MGTCRGSGGVCVGGFMNPHDLTNVERVTYDRDYRLVKEYWQRRNKDMEELKLYEGLREWFENKWKVKFIPTEIKQGRF